MIVVVIQQWGIVFANELQPQTDPLEATIASELWRWAFLPNEERDEITAVTSKLSAAIEYHLCNAFHLVEFTRSRGIWCDGVVELQIEKTKRCSFIIVGAAWCPNSLAPFELEFHFDRRRDPLPVRSIVRFGRVNNHKQLQSYGQKSAAKIVATRPTTIQDWAIAVEMTPSGP